MRDYWYKNAIVYSLDVETFMDSNGDGTGDFAGLTERLDYLAGLGITCLWLLPFYPSAGRDNGYDITDYYSIDPKLGTLGDFVEFMHKAKERGIRVIVDLVVNHTSNQHPWFQAARSDRQSPYRNFYVWADHPPEEQPDQVAFPTVEDSIWEYDDQAGAYYLHHFYKEQPDLNITNPAVRDEIERIMGFWLELGVSGFRIDAAPFMILHVTPDAEEQIHQEEFLEELRSFLRSRREDAVLLAESNVNPNQLSTYVQDGDRMHVLFNFLLNQYLFLALARQDAGSIHDGIKLLPSMPASFQWLNFLRHHDELTLDKLTDAERQEIFQAFAPEEQMQIFGRGIRRRLAPMFNNDPARIRLTYSLLLSLPGTPLIRYGAEIGMGDDLTLEERNSVRTPMQWDDAPNGGFSEAPADKLPRPVISDGEYGYPRINAANQQIDPQSLLNWIERAIRTRKQCPELGCGELHLLKVDEPAVFAHCCQWNNRAVIALHNLSDRPQSVTLPGSYSHLYEVLSDSSYTPTDPTNPTLSLTPYGYRWFRTTHF